MHATDTRREACREVLAVLLARRGRITLNLDGYRWLGSAGLSIADADQAAADLVASGRATLDGDALIVVPERSAAA